METRFFIADPKSVEMTLTMTMSLERWQELRAALPSRPAPCFWLTDAIRYAVEGVTEHFEGELPPKENDDHSNTD